MALIAIVLFGLFAAVWRIETGRMSKRESVVFAIAVAYFMLVVLQINIADKRPMPECRYWIQAGVLLFGWVVWGVDAIVQSILSRFPRMKFVRHLLVFVLCGFAAYDLVMVLKPCIPGSRRNINIRACEWAKSRIELDWRGPSEDETNPFSVGEYHIPNRPVIMARSRRLAYVLNGRNERMSSYGEIDIPDYIVNEGDPVELQKYNCKYTLIDRLEIGKRKFFLYRRAD